MLKNEPMRKHTSFKIGGIARFLVTPPTKESVFVLISYLKRNTIPYVILGNGSNLLIGDRGVHSVVVKTTNHLNDIKLEDECIIAESGVTLSRLAMFAARHGLKGLEFCAGIPGTLGGAIVMNAGAYGNEMKDVVESTTYIDEYTKVKEIKTEAHGFKYRNSKFNKMSVILSTKLRLKSGDEADIKQRMEELAKMRKKSQPVGCCSAGSVFKKVKVDGKLLAAAEFIEKAQLKGFKIGGAQVSDKHCGFIVNTGNATARDVLNLVSHIKQKVFNEFNIMLEPELKFIGEF